MLALVGAYLLPLRASSSGRHGDARRRRSSPTSSSSRRSPARSPRRASRRDAASPLGFTTLVPWLTAPFWWIDDVATAYGAIKYYQALVMTAAIFPAYALARFVVSPPWALFAAVGDHRGARALVRADPRRGAVRLPGRDARALADPRASPVRPTAARLALAGAAALLAMLVRSQLISLVADPRDLAARASAGARSRCAAGARPGRVATGSAPCCSGSARSSSSRPRSATGRPTGREVTANLEGPDRSSTASGPAGAFAIGVGLLPAIALLAIPFVPAPRARATRGCAPSSRSRPRRS